MIFSATRSVRGSARSTKSSSRSVSANARLSTATFSALKLPFFNNRLIGIFRFSRRDLNLRNGYIVRLHKTLLLLRNWNKRSGQAERVAGSGEVHHDRGSRCSILVFSQRSHASHVAIPGHLNLRRDKWI